MIPIIRFFLAVNGHFKIYANPCVKSRKGMDYHPETGLILCAGNIILKEFHWKVTSERGSLFAEILSVITL